VLVMWYFARVRAGYERASVGHRLVMSNACDFFYNKFKYLIEMLNNFHKPK